MPFWTPSNPTQSYKTLITMLDSAWLTALFGIITTLRQLLRLPALRSFPRKGQTPKRSGPTHSGTQRPATAGHSQGLWTHMNAYEGPQRSAGKIGIHRDIKAKRKGNLKRGNPQEWWMVVSWLTSIWLGNLWGYQSNGKIRTYKGRYGNIDN